MTNSNDGYPDKILYEVANFEIFDGDYEILAEDLEAAKGFMNSINGGSGKENQFSVEYTGYLQERVDRVNREKKRGQALKATAAFGAIFGRDPDNERDLIDTKFENILEYMRDNWKFDIDQRHVEIDTSRYETFLARVERIENYDVTFAEMSHALLEGFKAGKERAKWVNRASQQKMEPDDIKDISEYVSS